MNKTNTHDKGVGETLLRFKNFFFILSNNASIYFNLQRNFNGFFSEVESKEFSYLNCQEFFFLIKIV